MGSYIIIIGNYIILLSICSNRLVAGLQVKRRVVTGSFQQGMELTGTTPSPWHLTLRVRMATKAESNKLTDVCSR